MAEQDHDQQQQQQDVGDQVSPTYVFSPKNLANLTVPEMAALFQKHHPNGTVPNDLEQRCRLWNELGTALLQHFDGSAMQLIQRADGSAVHLVQLLVQYFPGFRDYVQVPSSSSSINNNNDDDDDNEESSTSTLYFLKRAQICVGDLQAALKLDEWKDVDQLTTFADYRLPQLLRHWQALQYQSPELQAAVDGCVALPAGSRAELSIRAATVVAVEELVRLLAATADTDNGNNNRWTAVQVDWYLWQVGEKMDAQQALAPHHRVCTIYY